MSNSEPPSDLITFVRAVQQVFPGAEVTRLVVSLQSQRDRELAKRAIDRAPVGYVADIHEQRRSDEQNRALWPRLNEIQRQRPTLGGTQMTPELWKCVFLQDLGAEMRMMPTLRCDGYFPLGHSSSALTKSQFADLLTSIDAYCAEQGIVLSHPSDSPSTVKSPARRVA